MSFDFSSTEVAHYIEWIEEHVEAGWKLYVITIMFNQLPGNQRVRLSIMQESVVKLYAIQLPRLVRRPRSPSSVGMMPIWIAVPDYPVHKTKKKDRLKDIVVNDGLHINVVVVVPPVTRLTESYRQHTRRNREGYLRAIPALQRVHLQRIKNDIPRAISYQFKSLVRRRASGDEILILPRTISELGPKRPKRVDNVIDYAA